MDGEGKKEETNKGRKKVKKGREGRNDEGEN